MSVEDAAALEMRFAAKTAPTSSSQADSLGRGDEEEEEEATTLKQRQWDDYKDAHPAGWGNRWRQG